MPPSPAPPRPAARRVTTVLLALAAVSGCSAEPELDVDGFRPGACASAVAPLQEVDDVLRRLEDDELSPRDAAARLAQAQDALAPLDADAQAPVSTSLVELGTRLGFFRLSVDTGSYDASEAADVRRALEGVARDCRRG